MSRIVLLHPSTGPAGLRQSLTDAGHLVITLGPPAGPASARALRPVSYTHLRAHET